MKENVRDRLKSGDYKAADILREIGRQALAAVMGFIMSRGVVIGSVMPFGLALAAAVPVDYLALTAMGCFAGYFIPAAEGASAFGYLAALFAIVAIKALLAGVTKYGDKPLVSAITAGLVTVGAGLVRAVGSTSETVLALAEGVLAGAAAWFIAKTFKASPSLSRGIKGEDMACLLITLCLPVVGAMSITPGDISVGKIICVAFILLTSRFGGVPAGAVCGIISGFACGISGGGLISATAFALAGLISGIFTTRGKYAQVGVLLVTVVVSSGLEGQLIETVKLLIESLFGSALFLCIPKTLVMRLGKFFSPPTRTATQNSMKKAVTMRLQFAAGALTDVSKTVDSVASELSRINSPDFEGVLKGIEKEACSGCSLCINCWETAKSDTITAVLDMIKGIKEGANEPETLAPDEFRGRCLRPARMGVATHKYYSDYASRMAAESRIADVRGVVADQFDGISNMLLDMAAELELDEAFDDATASKVAEALKTIDIEVAECSCRVDKYGRMTVELVCPTAGDVRYNRMRILRQAELCCDREFEAPALTEQGGRVFVTLTERAALSVETGVCQLACSPSGICGDAYSSFSDGRGRAYMIISDGMGSGGRAAVDGAMASGLMTRLIKAGFGYDCSLNIVNSSMLFKSTDESLATVDLMCIDLFSGRADMFKAGAAPTVVRRSGRCGVAQSTSLPAGILREVGFDKATVKLKVGDIALMLSDGVVAEGTDWICSELAAWGEGSARELAEHIAHCAQRRRSDNHQDDITVLAAIVRKGV